MIGATRWAGLQIESGVTTFRDLDTLSSYQRTTAGMQERLSRMPEPRLVSRADTNGISGCDSLGWTPDRVWSDEVLCLLIVFYLYIFNTTALTRLTKLILNFVIPAHDCKDAGDRAKQDARAEAGIQSGTGCQSRGWYPEQVLIRLTGATRWAGLQIESGVTKCCVR